MSDETIRLRAERDQAIGLAKRLAAGRDRALTRVAATEKEIERVRSIAGASRIDLYDKLVTAEKLIDEQNQVIKDNIEAIDDAQNAIKKLELILQQANIALEPFAEAADVYDPDEGDNGNIAWSHDFTIGSLRRARTIRKAITGTFQCMHTLKPF